MPVLYVHLCAQLMICIMSLFWFYSLKCTCFALTDLTIRGRSTARLHLLSACPAKRPRSKTLKTWLTQRNLLLIIHTGHMMASQNKATGTFNQTVQTMQIRCVFWSYCSVCVCLLSHCSHCLLLFSSHTLITVITNSRLHVLFCFWSYIVYVV